MLPNPGTDDAHDLPPGLEHTIRAVICTSDSPEDLVARVQRELGEHAAPSDEVHVSHAVAPYTHNGGLMYTALIVLRPRGNDEEPTS
jgi:hypothetical protein